MSASTTLPAPAVDASGRCSGTAFRAFMSRWPTGVSVVTTADGDHPVGCTVNAMMSVSLEPALLVVALASASRTLEAIRASGRFALNFLTADQQHLCRRFATPGPGDRFRGVPHHWRHGVPVLDAVGATTVCRVHDTMECGDHMLVVGSPLWQSTAERENPLVFYQRAYHDLARVDRDAGTRP
jgi:flavin reductase (DIM6/NTAB) family NADH-FMN oxidoreductase RutF